MRIDEALKLSDVAVNKNGIVVNKYNQYWYFKGGNTYSIHELKGEYEQDITWQPAYIRPQFKIGEKVPFLQACLSGQCFVVGGTHNIRRCISLASGEMQFYSDVQKNWERSTLEFCPSDICTIVADPSQEPEPEKRKRTHAEIVADIKTLVSELEDVK